MNWIDPYIFLLMILGVSSLLVSLALLRPPRKLVRSFLAVAAGLTGMFIILTVAELLTDDAQLMIVLRNLQQISLIFVPLMLLGYAGELYKEEGKKSIRFIGLLALPSFLDMTLVFTDAYHGWMRESIAFREVWGYSEVVIQSTALSSFLGSYSYVLTLLAVFILLRSMFDVPKQYRLTHGISAFVIVTPLLAITVVPLFSIEIPALFALSYGSMALLLIIVNKWRDVNVVWPVSRQSVLENMSEGIMLIDDRGVVMEANPAVCRMAGRLNDDCPASLIRKSIHTVFPSIEDFHHMEESDTMEFSFEQGETYFDVTVTKLAGHSRPLRLIVFNDVSDMKKVERQLELMATLDPLTGLINRKAFLDRYNKETKDREKTFILLDIDHFKKFNDRYGHVVGDEVLRYMSRMLERYFSEEGELVTRLGGVQESPQKGKRKNR